MRSFLRVLSARRLRCRNALLLVLGRGFLLMALQSKLGAAQSLANLFRRVGGGRMLEVLMHFMQVLMLDC